MAAKKTASKKTAPTKAIDPAVSLGLVLATIADLRTKGDMVRGLCGPAEKAIPGAPTVLSELSWPGGAPLPPSLLAWLAYDSPHLELFDDDGNLAVTSLRAFVTAEIEEVAEELDEDDFDPTEAIEAILMDEPLADAPALRFPDSASQAHFLVFDGSEEPPVLGYEKESFWVKWESFGDFAAAWFGGKERSER